MSPFCIRPACVPLYKDVINNLSPPPLYYSMAGTLIGSGGLEAIAQMLSKNSTLEGLRYDRGFLCMSSFSKYLYTGTIAVISKGSRFI